MTAVGRVLTFGPGDGPEFPIGPDRFRTKRSPRQRPGAFSVIVYEGAAGVPGPPPHVHRSFEEAWYILEGKVRFTSAGRSVTATPGMYLFVPRGVAHTFAVQGRKAARWLGILSPGRYVGLLEELGHVIPAEGPPDLAGIRRLFSRYDTELLPPGD